jgi:hypothetical protein
MSEISIYTSHTNVRILRPRASEDEVTFRTRMEAMITLLAERCPDTTAVVVERDEAGPVCVVTQRPSLDDERRRLRIE